MSKSGKDKAIKKGTGEHVHGHKHQEELHLHEHEHDGLTHIHPHFHKETVHKHPHDHEEAGLLLVHGHEHEHAEALTSHVHIHTYSFERFAHLVSPMHRLDARVKLIALLGLVIAVVLTPPLHWEHFLAYFALILVLVLASRLPLGFVLKRSAVILPLVLLVALFIPFLSGKIGGSYNLGFVTVGRSGLITLANICIKAWLSILTMILLSASTRFSLLLKGLESLKVPAVFIALLSFIYRFAAVLQDEVIRIKRARDSRSSGGSRAYQLRIIGQMLGSFFVRSYERSERIYQAMVARGFNGTVRTLDQTHLAAGDIIFGIAFLTVIIFIQTWRF